jgi:predicted amidohydrolase
VGGLVREGRQGKGRNEAVVFGPKGELLARYCKLHPFTLSGETARHEKGENLVFFEWDGMVAAPFICYDLRFPEIFRRATQRGAELLIVIALWPARRVEHWVTLLRARAIENQAWVIGVNRCGSEPDLSYPGRSVAVNPHGELVADAGSGEGLAHAEIDAPMLRQWRIDFPALKDIRNDLSA